MEPPVLTASKEKAKTSGVILGMRFVVLWTDWPGQRGLKQALIFGRALSAISLSRYSSHNVAISAAALQSVLQTLIEGRLKWQPARFAAVVLTGGLLINDSCDPLRGVSPLCPRATRVFVFARRDREGQQIGRAHV